MPTAQAAAVGAEEPGYRTFHSVPRADPAKLYRPAVGTTRSAHDYPLPNWETDC